MKARATSSSLPTTSKTTNLMVNDESNNNTIDSSTIYRKPDLSILQKPIQTSITGFNEAKKAFDEGTEEIRKLLAKECDIIYECKVCRNIFRSLVNFISHKRVYCKIKFNVTHHAHFWNDGGSSAILDQDLSTILQADQEYEQLRSSSATKSTTTHKNSGKDLGSIIDRLFRKEQAQQAMKLSDFYNEANKKICDEKDEQKLHTLQLDKIMENKCAVFQTVLNDNVTELSNVTIKNEVNEVHKMMENRTVTLGTDGKAITLNKHLNNDDEKLLPKKSLQLLQHICQICKSKFSTEKTLKLHIKAKHTPSTIVYPCPSCPQKFLTPAAVIRHLSNDHKKSMKRIRLMREAICRRRTRIDSILVKGPSRELARLQMDAANGGGKERSGESSSNSTNHSDCGSGSFSSSINATNRCYWPDNYNGNGETTVPDLYQSSISIRKSSATGICINTITSQTSVSSICTFCAKSFDRRAALITHNKTCAQRAAGIKTTLNNNKTINTDDSNNIGSGGGGNGSGGLSSSSSSTQQLLENRDEDSSNSTDSFIAMLNREKSMRAKVEELDNKMNLERQKLIELNSDNKNNYKSESLIINLLKNKRKRNNRAPQKSVQQDFVEIVEHTTTDEIDNNVKWNKRVNEENDCEIIETINNGDTIIKLDEMDTEQQIQSNEIQTEVVKNGEEKTSVFAEIQIKLNKLNSRTTDCTICFKKFANISNLRRHVSMFHYREKKFGCKLCEFKAFRKIDVINHIGPTHKIPQTERETYKEMVILIDIDKNKFNDEKFQAIAHALVKLEEEDAAAEAAAAALVAETTSAAAQAAEAQTSDSRRQIEDQDDEQNYADADIIIPLLMKEDLDDGELDEMITLDEDVDLLETELIAKPLSTNSSANSSDLEEKSHNNIDEDDFTNLDLSQTTTINKIKISGTQIERIKRRGRPKGYKVPQKFINPATPPSVQSLSSSSSSTSSVIQTTLLKKQLSRQIPPPKPTKIGKKITRHSSHNSISSEESSTSSAPPKRPVRNRIKAVNKDFVYDLSNLLKKEAESYKEHNNITPTLMVKSQKRKHNNALLTVDDNITGLGVSSGGCGGGFGVSGSSSTIGDKILENGLNVSNNESSINSSNLISTPVVKKNIKIDIRGAALVMAEQAVQENKACFNQPPEIPSERPIVPAKIIASRRSYTKNSSSSSIIQDLPIEPELSSNEDENMPSMRRLSNEKLLDALTKRYDKLQRLAESKKQELNEQDISNILKDTLAAGPSPIKKIKRSSHSNGDGGKGTQSNYDYEEHLNTKPASILKSPKNDYKNMNYRNPILSPTSTPPLSPRPSSSHQLTITHSDIIYSNIGNRNNDTDTGSVSSSSSSSCLTKTSCGKRITLMQRLAENKTKKLQENMFKLTIDDKKIAFNNEEPINNDDNVVPIQSAVAAAAAAAVNGGGDVSENYINTATAAINELNSL